MAERRDRTRLDERIAVMTDERLAEVAATLVYIYLGRRALQALATGLALKGYR